MDDLYMDDLDIYNISLNADTEQGSSFLNYRKQYAKASGNNHDLLAESSSPELGSIIEAIDGTDSVSQYKSVIETALSKDQAAFNTLLTQYTTDYNSYISSAYITNAAKGIKPSVTDSSNNIIAKANLQSLNGKLIALAQTIISQINSLQTTDSTFKQKIKTQEASLIDYINKFKEQHQKFASIRTDQDSLDGAIETSSLSMNSVYFHYIVYFFIGIILIVFIFNLSINPEADVMKASFFIIALSSIYIISRWVNK